MRRSFDLVDKFRRDWLKIGRKCIVWLRNEVECAHRKGLECCSSSGSCVRAYNDDRKLETLSDFLQRFNAIHARHLEIECHDVGLEFRDLLQRKRAIHRGTDNMDRAVALQYLRDQL